MKWSILQPAGCWVGVAGDMVGWNVGFVGVKDGAAVGDIDSKVGVFVDGEFIINVGDIDGAGVVAVVGNPIAVCMIEYILNISLLLSGDKYKSISLLLPNASVHVHDWIVFVCKWVNLNVTVSSIGNLLLYMRLEISYCIPCWDIMVDLYQ